MTLFNFRCLYLLWSILNKKKLGLYNLSSINTRKFQKIGYFPVKPALHHVYMYVTPKNRNPIATLWWIPALVYKNYSKQSLPLALPFPILRKRKIIKNYKANIRLEIPSMTIGSAIYVHLSKEKTKLSTAKKKKNRSFKRKNDHVVRNTKKTKEHKKNSIFYTERTHKS